MLKLRTKKRYILAIFGIFFCLGHSITLYYVFLRAYFSGNMESTVAINLYNEAQFEFILIPVTIGVGIWSIKYFLYRPDWKEEEI